MTGIIIKSTGSWYKVLNAGNEIIDCKARGKLKITNQLKATNPMAVGDKVEFNMEPNDIIGTIEQIHDRKNYIIRKAANLSKQVHILAANIDMAFLVTSVVHPEVSLRFVDRFLVTCEAYNVPVSLVINKCDIEPALQYIHEVASLYRTIGYDVYITSAKSGKGVEALQEAMSQKINLFAGFSGVGKTSLINNISPKLELKTNIVSDSSLKGKHTTTFAEMFAIGNNSYLIDTPGIKGLGLWEIEKKEISHFFPEMSEVLHDCKFNTCLHMGEPGCAVMQAVADGQIDERRYESYMMMLEESETYR